MVSLFDQLIAVAGIAANPKTIPMAIQKDPVKVLGITAGGVLAGTGLGLGALAYLGGGGVATGAAIAGGSGAATAVTGAGTTGAILAATVPPALATGAKAAVGISIIDYLKQNPWVLPLCVGGVLLFTFMKK